MFNFFRRRKSEDNLSEFVDKMPPDDDRLADENQNEVDCVVRNGILSAPGSKYMDQRKNGKKVRWAEIMEQIHQEVDDGTSQVTSSEDEEEEEDSSKEEEEDDSQEEEEEEEDEDEKDEEEELEEEEEESSSEESDEEDEAAVRSSPKEESLNMEQLKQLKCQLTQLDRDMTAKSSLINRLQRELREAYEEAETAKYRMASLQQQLEETKERLEQADTHEKESNKENDEDNTKREERLKEAEKRIAELEMELKQVIMDKEELEQSFSVAKTDRDQQIASIQKAYEDALKEQEDMMIKFEEDFEELRTLNSRREQQMLEDFEWKLREVEKNCKARVEKRDKDKDREIAHLVVQLADANVKLEEVKQLELCKAELEQTKSCNLELKRNLRTTNRRLEQVQVNEKVLQEETSRLRTQLDKEKSFVTNLQLVHREELDERERKNNFRLDAQKNLLNSEWEDKMKKEMRQLKLEMEMKARSENIAAVEEIKRQMNQRISTINKNHDDKVAQINAQVEDLKERLTEEESDHKEALENLQSKSDSELMELRRKMEKLYMSYEEKIEKLNEQHETHINRIQEESEKRVQQVENNFHLQSGTTRATVELVKEQLHRENQSRLQQLENQHQRQLEEQWMRMNKDKEEALKAQETKHKELLKEIQSEMERLKRHSTCNSLQQQSDKSDDTVFKDLSMKSSPNGSIKGLENQVQPHSSDKSTSQQSLREEELGEAEASLLRERERLDSLTLKAKMCQTIQQLTHELEASKKEIDMLNNRMRLKSSSANPPVSEAIHPLNNEQPTPPPRGKGRNTVANSTSQENVTVIHKEVPTAKVQPQPMKEQMNPPMAKVQPRSVTPNKEQNSREQTKSPAKEVETKQRPNLQQQTNNQSRRSRKNRSRRH